MARKPSSSAPSRAPAPISKPITREPSRSTIGVSRALDQARREMPSVLYQRSTRPVRQEPQRPALSQAQVNAMRERQTPMPERREPRQLDLKRPQEGVCKSRPSRSSGSGGSRPFVPWCSRR